MGSESKAARLETPCIEVRDEAGERVAGTTLAPAKVVDACWTILVLMETAVVFFCTSALEEEIGTVRADLL